MATEMRWNKNWGSLSSPLTSEIRRPKSYRKEDDIIIIIIII